MVAMIGIKRLPKTVSIPYHTRLYRKKHYFQFSFTNAPNRHISRFDDSGDRVSRRSKNTEVDSMHTTPTCSTASSPKGSSSCSESIQTDSPAITKSSRLKLPGSTKKKPSGSSLSKLSGTGSKPEVRKSGSSKSELTKTKSKKSGSKKFPKTVYPRISADGSVVPDFQFDLDPIPLKPRTSRSSSNSSSN